MTSVDFIINQLKNLISLYPQLSVKYEYDEVGSCHYVEVLPAEDYYSNTSYIEFERQLEKNFCNYFTGEVVCFLTEGDLFKISNVDFEMSGILYRKEIDSNITINLEGLSLIYPGWFNSKPNFGLANYNTLGLYKTLSQKIPTKGSSVTYSDDMPELLKAA